MLHRKSPRASRYDYTSPWGYFVTICTKNREHYFGEICDNKMILNELGKHTQQCRNNISHHFPFVDIHEFVCMPNHIHGIFIIRDHQGIINNDVGTQDFVSSDNKSIKKDGYHPSLQPNQCASQSVWSIIRWFKIGVTKYARENNINFSRQDRYHDRIIRNEWEYERIKYYIQTNPINREWDSLK